LDLLNVAELCASDKLSNGMKFLKKARLPDHVQSAKWALIANFFFEPNQLFTGPLPLAKTLPSSFIMSIAIAVWCASYPTYTFVILIINYRSTVLKPGDTVEVTPPTDLRITNIALGEEVADANSRTSVRMIYRPPMAEEDEDEEDKDDSGALATTILASLTPGKVCSYTAQTLFSTLKISL
jgi:hypothetical protein